MYSSEWVPENRRESHRNVRLHEGIDSLADEVTTTILTVNDDDVIQPLRINVSERVATHIRICIYPAFEAYRITLVVAPGLRSIIPVAVVVQASVIMPAVA